MIILSNHNEMMWMPWWTWEFRVLAGTSGLANMIYVCETNSQM